MDGLVGNLSGQQVTVIIKSHKPNGKLIKRQRNPRRDKRWLSSTNQPWEDGPVTLSFSEDLHVFCPSHVSVTEVH